MRPGKDPLPLKIPQFAGSLGWILLSHNGTGEPDALFVDSKEKATPIQIVMDERMCSDTVIRVTQLASDLYVAQDIRWLNGSPLGETLSYRDRLAKLSELLDAFHSPDLTALCLPDTAPVGTPVRGWETYDETPGSMGVFLRA